jgi:hypothetical protein
MIREQILAAIRKAETRSVGGSGVVYASANAIADAILAAQGETKKEIAVVDTHGSRSAGWIGVDLDGTLAVYNGWVGPHHIGEPIPKMVARVVTWIADGKEVRIVTARVSPNKSDHEECRGYVEKWLRKHIYSALPETPAGTECVIPITHEKDHLMLELWDDRCVQLIPNTGDRADAMLAAQVPMPVPDGCSVCPIGDVCNTAESGVCTSLWQRLNAHFGRGE